METKVSVKRAIVDENGKEGEKVENMELIRKLVQVSEVFQYMTFL